MARFQYNLISKHRWFDRGHSFRPLVYSVFKGQQTQSFLSISMKTGDDLEDRDHIEVAGLMKFGV